MDSDVMSAGDDDDLISRVFGASQRIERGGEDGLFAGERVPSKSRAITREVMGCFRLMMKS
jgi:hypothetical protein